MFSTNYSEVLALIGIVATMVIIPIVGIIVSGIVSPIVPTLGSYTKNDVETFTILLFVLVIFVIVVFLLFAIFIKLEVIPAELYWFLLFYQKYFKIYRFCQK